MPANNVDLARELLAAIDMATLNVTYRCDLRHEEHEFNHGLRWALAELQNTIRPIRKQIEEA